MDIVGSHRELGVPDSKVLMGFEDCPGASSSQIITKSFNTYWGAAFFLLLHHEKVRSLTKTGPSKHWANHLN